MDSNGYSDPYVKWWVSCFLSLICFIQWLSAYLLWDRSLVKDIKAKEKLCCFLGVGILQCQQSKIVCSIEEMGQNASFWIPLWWQMFCINTKLFIFCFIPPPPPMEHSRFFRSLTPPFQSRRWDCYYGTENSDNGWVRIILPRRSS